MYDAFATQAVTHSHYQDAFYDNLKFRYEKEKYYTYIGEVVVAVNPYKHLDIFGPDTIAKYLDKAIYQVWHRNRLLCIFTLRMNAASH